MVHDSIANGWRVSVQATGDAILTVLDHTVGRLLDTNPDKVT